MFPKHPLPSSNKLCFHCLLAPSPASSPVSVLLKRETVFVSVIFSHCTWSSTLITKGRFCRCGLVVLEISVPVALVMSVTVSQLKIEAWFFVVFGKWAQKHIGTIGVLGKTWQRMSIILCWIWYLVNDWMKISLSLSSHFYIHVLLLTLFSLTLSLSLFSFFVILECFTTELCPYSSWLFLAFYFLLKKGLAL